MNSLTGTEQRFVLAEIIKSSSVDVHALAGFVKSHSLAPDWYNMQLPNGRNLNQCIKFAQTLSLPGLSTHLSSPSHNEHADQNAPNHARCHRDTTSPPDGHSVLPPAAPGQFHILPRPANGVEGNESSGPPFAKTPAKKRGRPSRSEMSRRDMPPRLPPPIAPRPPLPTPGSNAPTPRTILPATARGLESIPSLPPANPPSTLSNGPRSRKKRRLNSPPATPIVNRISTPTPPTTAPTPPAVVSTVAKATSNGQDKNDQTNNNNKTPISDSP